MKTSSRLGGVPHDKVSVAPGFTFTSVIAGCSVSRLHSAGLYSTLPC